MEPYVFQFTSAFHAPQTSVSKSGHKEGSHAFASDAIATRQSSEMLPHICLLDRTCCFIVVQGAAKTESDAHQGQSSSCRSFGQPTLCDLCRKVELASILLDASTVELVLTSN